MKFRTRVANWVYRKLASAIDLKRAYEAAENNRLTLGWLSGQTQIDADIRQGIIPTRQRARNMEQNDPIGKKFLRLCQKNIPGAFGFTLKMKIFRLTEEGKKKTDRIANQAITDAFLDWCKRSNCDVSDQLTFRAMQLLQTNHACRDGEFLARGYRNKSKYGFQLQILDPEIIDETKNGELDNGNVVIMGIEFDKSRRRVAYWLRKYNPAFAMFGTGFSGEVERIPANQIYYGFDIQRAFQSRGMSMMTPSMKRIWRISEYESASLSNATIAARRLGFLESKPEELPGNFTGNSKTEDGDIIIDTEEGSFHKMPRGWHMNMPESQFPDAQHEMFTKAVTRNSASGLDVGYMTLASDPSDANYSSARLALLDERETWMMLQEWIIESFLEPVFHDWLIMALTKGAIKFPDKRKEPLADFEYYDKPYFVGRRWPWVDPQKDAEATRIRLKMGLTSLVREAAQNGDDLEEIFEEAQYANELAEKYGVTISFESKNSGQPSEPEPPEDDANTDKKLKKEIENILES